MTVYGARYFAGPCRDVVTAGEPLPSALPERAVVLALRTADGTTLDVATAHPDHDASFTVTVRVPAHAPSGPAIITDDRGHTIDLVIAGS